MDDFTQPIDHGREGSPVACAVLVLLHAHAQGMPLADIVTHLQLPASDVRQAIIGLSERRRVRSIGRTTAARWYTMPHAAAVAVQS